MYTLDKSKYTDKYLITNSSDSIPIYNYNVSGSENILNTSSVDTIKKNHNLNLVNDLHQSSRIIIIGTAHVSEKSVQEVDEVISKERPDIVAVELCKSRYDGLKGKKIDAEIPIKDILKSGKIYYYLIHMMLAYVQNKFADEMDIKPGAEMIKAMEIAEMYGSNIALIDRDIQITLQRFWNKMGFIEKLKIFGGLIAAILGIGGTKDIDMNTITNQDVVSMLVEEFRNTSPNAVKVLIDERDAYMASNIIQLAKEGKKIVAVVGAGHKEGIQKYLMHPETLPDLHLVDTPVHNKKINFLKIFSLFMLAIPVVAFLLLVISGISLKTLAAVFFWWFIITGGLSALGTALARGHPISILTSFLVAWMTTLNPAVAAGWYAGIQEAKYRNPTTKDLKMLMSVENVSEMTKNNFFRVMMVMALSNLGAMVGSIVGAYVILQIAGIDAKEFLETALYTGLRSLGL